MAPAAAGPAAPVWDIATPSRPLQVAGVSMAGFRQRGPGPVDLEIVPFPAVTVTVDLGSQSPELADGAGARHRGSVVAGMAPGGVRATGRGIECVQIRMSPVLARRVLGVVAEADGTVHALEDVWGSAAHRFEERLRETPSWDDRFAIVEDELARRCSAADDVAPELAFAWRELVTSLGQARIEDVASDVGWSRKRMWLRFRAELGIGPKRAAQLIRFDEAAHRLAAGHGPARAAVESGYVDQSHLHRDAMTFAGKTPSQIADAAWLAVDEVAWPGATHRPAS